MTAAEPSGRIGAIRALRRHGEVGKLLAMMGLSFLVIFVVGVLRPIRDAFALDSLAIGAFYQVYFVSAIVVVFVPFYNRLADRIPWRQLIPRVAFFFAASMVFFRLIYQPGEAWFGLTFYGWYDLMVAALVTQFFMATQIFYNARDAKRAYPLVIAAGSVGAATGGGITAFFAERLGTPNLLLVAAVAIAGFAVGIALVWARANPDEGRPTTLIDDRDLSVSEFRRIFSNPQVRLIAATVLLTILVKQFVDYEYKTLTREVYPDVDELSGFLGLVDAATQWLPIVVLLSLRPILRRWGVMVAVVIFPVAMILATGALAISMTLAVAVVARTTERMFRYSAERTGREILYVPVPGEIKLKAKAYIDVAVEKGIGKALSGVLLAIPAVALAALPIRQMLAIVALAGLGLAVLLLFTFLRVRSQYLRTLAESFEGRFASLRGTYVSIAEAGALDMARHGLGRSEPLKVAFTLDLLHSADSEDLEALAPELHDLLEHESPEVRAQALSVLARAPAAVEEGRVRPRLRDPDRAVREAAVRALAAASGRPPEENLHELLESDDGRVRVATLACLGIDLSPAEAEPIVRPHFEKLLARGPAGEDGRQRDLELATAAGLLPGHPKAAEVVRTLISHDDPEVARAAVRSAGHLEEPGLLDDLIEALGPQATRNAAREALAEHGETVLPPLISVLNDPETDPWIRRGVASLLGDIPSPDTVEALIGSYFLPETEQALDDRALASLQRLRERDEDLPFPEERILAAVDREVAATRRYVRAAARIADLEPSRSRDLLSRALADAQRARQEAAFNWLGLLHPQYGMHRTFQALTSGDDRQRANALEWLESTVGHTDYLRLRPMLEPRAGEDRSQRDADDLLRALWNDEDAWIARCALWTSFEVSGAGMQERLDGYEPVDPALEDAVRHIEARIAREAAAGATEGGGEQDMDLIEKVFLLQNIDLLSGVDSQQLALLASIAGELEVDGDKTLIRKGEPTDALYVVIHGEVALEGMGEQRVTVSDGKAFGTWALIDEQPSLVEARALEPTRLLRIRRIDFRDLLVDHPELGLDLLQGLARRVRSLATAAT